MSKGTTRRTVRVEDGLWEEAQAAASERGGNLSDVIRDAIRQYIQEKRGKPVNISDGSCCEPDSGSCCGPGSWCCARAGKHDHDEEGTSAEFQDERNGERGLATDDNPHRAHN
jgi:hypothetical protein